MSDPSAPRNLTRAAWWSGLALACVAAGASGRDYDLRALPLYTPRQAQDPAHCHGAVCHGVWGVIRISGTELTQHLIHLWEDNFLKRNPNIRFGDYFVPSGFAGLAAQTADVCVIGHSAWRSDLESFEEVFGYPPLEIMFATGGFDEKKGNTPGVIVFVNRQNPLSGLTLRQLDGIFGAERSGGWKGTQWSTESARGPADDIRTWGELGLKGKWMRQPIHVYGLDHTLSNWSELMQRVAFEGGDKWNPAMKEFVRGGTEVPADVQLVNAVARDPYGIGFDLMRVIEKNPAVKPLALSPAAGRPYVQPTRQTMYRRTYPLSNAVYIYINRVPGRPISPRLREFLTYILSRQGQRDVVSDGMFIPLNPRIDREQLEKLR
jgi:phosphate transport system substrate-binding protein